MCVGCPAGSYSLGNGEAFDNFHSTNDFNVKCEAPSCTRTLSPRGGSHLSHSLSPLAWSAMAGDLVSGSGISFVELIRNFKSGQGSNVEFEYKIVGHTSKLEFYIDNDLVFEDKAYTLGVSPFSPLIREKSYLYSE